MAVSSTATFDPTFIFIVTSAYRKMGVINENETPTAGMFQDASYAINSLIKEWQALGIHVWTEEEGILFLQPGQVRYLIGGTTTDNAADAYSFVAQTLSATANATATSVTVADATGITIGQSIGIVLDGGSTQWTTVSHIPLASVVRLAVALTGPASSGNAVFVYTSKITRPLKMPSARLYFYSSSPTDLRETPMDEFSRKEYMDLPIKTNQGTPTSFFYTPARPSGLVYIWPAPQNSNYGVRFTWYRPLDDYLSNDNTSDLPPEWISALTWNLAVEMAPDFSIPVQRFGILKAIAAEKLDLVQGYDREAQPIYFQLADPESGG